MQKILRVSAMGSVDLLHFQPLSGPWFVGLRDEKDGAIDILTGIPSREGQEDAGGLNG